MQDDTRQAQEVQRTSQSLYKSAKVRMPKPELYIIYTGNKGRKPEIISLSQEFFDGADIDIEVKAKVIYESDTEDIINQYIVFCKVFDTQRKLYGMTEKTVKKTIRICKDRETAERMIKKGKMTLEEIADYIPTLSLDELKEIEIEIMQLA